MKLKTSEATGSIHVGTHWRLLDVVFNLLHCWIFDTLFLLEIALLPPLLQLNQSNQYPLYLSISCQSMTMVSTEGCVFMFSCWVGRLQNRLHSSVGQFLEFFLCPSFFIMQVLSQIQEVFLTSNSLGSVECSEILLHLRLFVNSFSASN